MQAVSHPAWGGRCASNSKMPPAGETFEELFDLHNAEFYAKIPMK